MERLNITSKKLQAADTDLYVVTKLYSSLKEYVCGIREDFDVYENAALVKSNVTEYEDARKRKRKIKIPPDKTREGDIEFSGRDNFKINTYCVVIDRLIAELAKR